jgi:hypothetical protein
MSFRNREKKRLIALKPKLFSLKAQTNGYYAKYKKRYPFCLNEFYADENLHESIRYSAIKYFADRNIPWHDGNGKHPSNHLCCSQSACINSFYPYRNQPLLLKNVLLDLGYPVKEILPIKEDKTTHDDSDSFVAFEWIGTMNYLSELEYGKIAANSNRSRGKGFTSADFAILFERTDNKIQLILGEWKYTEDYSGKGSKRFSNSNTDRLNSIYAPYLKINSPINISPCTDYSILFFDPFDQLMRLQLLAKQMELLGELDADFVTVLHIAPGANENLMLYIPNFELKSIGTNIHNIWMKITEQDKFKGFYLENLIDIITKKNNSPAQDWPDYLKTRYSFSG